MFRTLPPSFSAMSAIETAIEDDADDRVEGIGREFFGAGHEIAGSVVDDGVDAAELLVGEIRDGFDSAIVADVTSGKGRGAAAAVNFVADFLERLFAASGEEHSRAEHGEVQSHGAAEAGAAAGQEDGAILQQILLKHASTA